MDILEELRPLQSLAFAAVQTNKFKFSFESTTLDSFAVKKLELNTIKYCLTDTQLIIHVVEDVRYGAREALLDLKRLAKVPCTLRLYNDQGEVEEEIKLTLTMEAMFHSTGDVVHIGDASVTIPSTAALYAVAIFKRS